MTPCKDLLIGLFLHEYFLSKEALLSSVCNGVFTEQIN